MFRKIHFLLYPKILQIKVVEHWILYKKSWWVHMSASLQSGPIGSKDWYVLNIILYWNGDVDSVWGSMLPKIRIIWENALNKKLLNIEFCTKPNSSTLVGDRFTRPLTFLCNVQCSITFIWRIFVYNAYFRQRQVLKWIYFSIFVQYNISKKAIFEASSSTPGGDKHVHPLTLLYGIQCSTTFFEPFLDIMRIFGSVEP